MSVDAAFCFPCRVFSNNSFDSAFKTTGFRLWARALANGRGLNKHSNGPEHQTNMARWQAYINQVSVDIQLSDERKKQIEFRSQERQERYSVLSILFDITNTLARLHLPFRGHDESLSSSNKGVFLEITDLVGRWNKELSMHLSKSRANPNGYPSYTSAKSQNEMIHTIAELLRKFITAEIKEAGYFAISMDTTPDLSRNEQLSFVIRYVSKDGEINESLLELVHAKNCTAEGLFEQFQNFLMKHDIAISNLRGQSFDGCATMAGKYRGLQARIREVAPYAYFVHCYAHRLNLVLVDVCSKVAIGRNFFGTVQRIYVFIENSVKRHGLFKEFQTMMNENEDNAKASGTLASVSNTRWSSRVDSCLSLKKNINSIVRTLKKIVYDASFDRDTASDALAIFKSIDFDFCLCLTIFSDILHLTNVVSKTLQKVSVDIAAATCQVEALRAELSARRSDERFFEFWKETEEMAESIEVAFVEPRIRKVSKRLDDHVETEVILSGQESLKVNFYFQTLDAMTTALDLRFSDKVLPLLKSVGSLMHPKSTNLEEIVTLGGYFQEDINLEDLKQEYILFCRTHNIDTISKKMTNLDRSSLHMIYRSMIQKEQSSIYPNLSKLYKLVLTLPVSSASCERSFSALKIIKNRLRTAMTNERLRDLLIIAVESRRVKNTALDEMVEYFWNEFSAERR